MGNTVVFGVFAHNEESSLPTLLDCLARQTVFARDDIDARLMILSNGSRDGTVAVARAHPIAAQLGDRFEVRDHVDGGKSRTWNRFLEEPAAQTAEWLGFLDADIRIDDPGLLAGLVDDLAARPDLAAAVTRPVPLPPARKSLLTKLIHAGTGSGWDWKTSICGQLYVMRGSVARGFRLPVGLPVEDGYVRAMIMTDCFESPPWQPDRGPCPIDGRDGAEHFFEHVETLGALIGHQTRIVIGSAINAVLYAHISAQPKGARRAMVLALAQEDGAVARLMAQELPRWPSGWVPFRFLTARSLRILKGAARPGGAKKLALLPAFFAYDLVVYLKAQALMARGKGQGFW